MKNPQITALTILFLIITAVLLPAQDEENSYGIFATRQDYHDFMGSVKQEGINNPELMAMVPMINDVVLLQPFGSTSKTYGTADGTLGMLSNEFVRKELEMIDSQYEEIQAANNVIQKRFAERIRMLDLDDMKSAVEQILALRQESEKELQATLLPHQMKRLRQLSARNQLRQRSLIEIITSDPMKDELEVSDEQAKDLRTAERKIEEELQQQIKKLRAKAQKRLLSNLKSEQRKLIEEIFGAEIGGLGNNAAKKK